MNLRSVGCVQVSRTSLTRTHPLALSAEIEKQCVLNRIIDSFPRKAIQLKVPKDRANKSGFNFMILFYYSQKRCLLFKMFKYCLKQVLIQRILIGFEVILEQLFLASYYKQLSADMECTIIRLKPVFLAPRCRRHRLKNWF